jgi:hypothetical protein
LHRGVIAIGFALVDEWPRFHVVYSNNILNCCQVAQQLRLISLIKYLSRKATVARVAAALHLTTEQLNFSVRLQPHISKVSSFF